ncbi:X-Pro dipeptidyl-peptidase [Actinoalloteichus hoggarensis]|uniref:Xaa-Pro dipeptidyl-peptidase n=1 Tax=Actinoalloteichus hoggarensis TaxID=1470176 RepID=A0A221W0J3_9PSEU|nr:Xaa-Pro dipeptidyl-peptidase [Actinoalloteichus hoggarensis]ASO19279.1 Xaa-Pro dipeptidyl-peptidase [Actinoalloteichus hoggarensis]MBB5920517.1 X-Pro dipeptidyl-peptidase [Actinoalloteichus hoggarensis]
MRRARGVLLAAALTLPVLAVPALAAPALGEQDHDVTATPSLDFEGGASQPVLDPTAVIRESLYVQAPVDSDGDGRDDEVYVEVVRPDVTEDGLRLPVVYFVSPYFSGGNPLEFHDVDVELHVPGQPAVTAAATSAARDAAAGQTAARPAITSAYESFLLARGYAVVYAESLGTGLSTGCPTTGGENETIGARSVVDWLNGRAPGRDAAGEPVDAGWTTGHVGMMGVSYNGTLPNAVAATGVEGLEVVVPIGAISSWYDYYRADGAVVAPGGYQGEDADVLAEYVHTRADREVCAPVIDALTEQQDRVTGDYNRFWDERNYLNDADRVQAAVLAVHGLADWNVKTGQVAQWYDALAQHDVPRAIWLHQAGHVDPLSVRREEWLDTLNRWFTNYLHRVDNGVAQEPRATVQREDGSWTVEADWPAPGTSDASLWPWPGGAAEGALDPSYAVPGSATVERFFDDATKSAQSLVDSPRSGNRLAYYTPPATEDVRLSGTPRVDFAVSFTRPAANLSALLVDRAPDGDTRIITRGWTDPQNRDAVDRTSPIVPGETYRVELAMQAQDYVLPAGHELGLVLLSSDRDFTLRPAPGAGLAVELGRTRLILPTVGGRSTLTQAFG